MRGRFLLGTLFLAVSTAASAQTDGPLHAAILRASRTTPLLTHASEGTADQWKSVMRLAPGKEMNLTVEGGSAARRTMVAADDASLIVLNLTSGALSDVAKNALVAMAVRAPEKFRLLQSDGVHIVDRSITLSADGLFVGTTKAAELREVVELIPRDAIHEIYLESHHGSLVWTAVGGGAGFLAGVMTGLALSESEANSCTSSQCSHVGSTAALFGLPAAGAAIGYFATEHERREIIYRGSK
jgi:hypothetical protein